MIRIWSLVLSTLLLVACSSNPLELGVPPQQSASATRFAGHGSIRLAYRVYGRKNGPPLVVLNGVGQATRFDKDPFTQALVHRGFHVIRLDNRDSGLSSRVKDEEEPSDSHTAYRLEDMAADVSVVLEAEGIPAAHIMGVSLGGMISQVFARRYPTKTLSLISVSSTTGKPGIEFGPAMAHLQEPPASTREARVEQIRKLYPHFASSRYPMTPEEVESRATADLHNDDPAASARQGMAAISSGDRTLLLRKLQVPALVIHGSADALFPLQHGRETAKAIPDAKLSIIDGMGHVVSDTAAEPVAQAIYIFVHSLC